ncbi:hypothetical protein G7Y89_g11991 [Cudoniella acicularis]|uniref:Uncharacterized protein n=1 Tax=Cudoniella acicularis TaxID=354080 RepID=A0A8H4RC93_9HELO|nr:hypothetical protein G7Y89_g11991 [Cudoniella acicularis]
MSTFEPADLPGIGVVIEEVVGCAENILLGAGTEMDIGSFRKTGSGVFGFEGREFVGDGLEAVVFLWAESDFVGEDEESPQPPVLPWDLDQAPQSWKAACFSVSYFLSQDVEKRDIYSDGSTSGVSALLGGFVDEHIREVGYDRFPNHGTIIACSRVIWSDEATFEVRKSGMVWVTWRVDEKRCANLDAYRVPAFRLGGGGKYFKNTRTQQRVLHKFKVKAFGIQ